MIQNTNCQNLNHGRVDAPVHACPMCGKVVNGIYPLKTAAKTNILKVEKIETSIV